MVGGDVGRKRICGAESSRRLAGRIASRRAHARIAGAAVNGCLEILVVIKETRAIGAVAENVIRPLAQRDAVHERQAKITIRLPFRILV